MRNFLKLTPKVDFLALEKVYHRLLTLASATLTLDIMKPEADPPEITLASLQDGGFPIGAENLAIDLADTLVTVTDPTTDLLFSKEDNDRFWRLHSAWLPQGWITPELQRTRALRDAVRRIFDNVICGEEPIAADLELVNATAGLGPVTYEIARTNGEFNVFERWHSRRSTDLALAAAARSAIDLLTESAQLEALRRCANPACSMLFFKGDSRRRWCTPNICANRDRAARHYERRRKAKPA